MSVYLIPASDEDKGKNSGQHFRRYMIMEVSHLNPGKPVEIVLHDVPKLFRIIGRETRDSYPLLSQVGLNVMPGSPTTIVTFEEPNWILPRDGEILRSDGSIKILEESTEGIRLPSLWLLLEEGERIRQFVKRGLWLNRREYYIFEDPWRYSQGFTSEDFLEIIKSVIPGIEDSLMAAYDFLEMIMNLKGSREKQDEQTTTGSPKGSPT